MERISVASQIAMVVTIIVSIGVPIALFLYFAIKKKAKKICFVIGAITFILFALILERFLHGIMLSTFGNTLLTNTAFIAIYSGLAAGIFEETGRLVAMKTVMKKNLTKENALMYGVGHGGIESIIIVGLTYISNLVTSIMINAGTLGPMLEKLDEDTRAQTIAGLAVLAKVTPTDFYLAGVERVIAITLHIGLSYLVYRAVKNNKYGLFVLAILIHAVIDGITVSLANVIPVYGLEIILFVLVAVFTLFVYKAYKNEANAEIQAD